MLADQPRALAGDLRHALRPPVVESDAFAKPLRAAVDVRVSETRALEVYERRDGMGCGRPNAGALHLITCEYPPVMGGVSEHSRVLAEAAVAEGYDVEVWTRDEGHEHPEVFAFDRSSAIFRARRSAARMRRSNAFAPPRRLVVQWVPHGYGRRGLNVAFTRWLRRRARAGDRIDLIVHEPFMDFFGASWRAAGQRAWCSAT